MIHRLSLAAAPRCPALWPAGRRTTLAPASEVAATPSLPEELRPGSLTPPALPCPPLWATLWASRHHSILVSGKHPQSAQLSSHGGKYFSFHLHRGSTPHSATRLRLFLRRSGRDAGPAVRRRCGGGRSLPSHPPGYSGAHSCRADQHHAVPEQGLWI